MEIVSVKSNRATSFEEKGGCVCVDLPRNNGFRNDNDDKRKSGSHLCCVPDFLVQCGAMDGIRGATVNLGENRTHSSKQQ